MQTRTCPLCGLAAPDLPGHTGRAHGTTLDAAEELLAEGRRHLAARLEQTARREGTPPTIFHDAATGGAMREGGYL